MSPPTFTTLPPELRTQIYTHLLHPTPTTRLSQTLLPILLTSRQTYLEARKTFHSINTFIRISTPWEQAKYHVALDGKVSILLTDAAAEKFNQYTLSVRLNAYHTSLRGLGGRPEGDDDEEERMEGDNYFVILLETGDLEKFCRSWFYSSVSMPGLNGHLELRVKFFDPYVREGAFSVRDKVTGKAVGEASVSKLKQRRLLEPFGQIKGLRNFAVDADDGIQVYPSVVAAVRKEMAIPLDPPEVCLEKATELKDKGNEALTKGRFEEAIEIYNKAFLAVHVVIEGKNRRVHGDGWFDVVISKPGSQFHEQHAGRARIVLRVRLVANTVLAWLKLKNYEMAIHTGMRTIKIMRSSIGLDEEEGALDPTMEAMSNFVAGSEMGKIYYRTALAYKEMDEKDQARKLLKVAVVYLPNDRTVRNELASVALRLG